MNRNKPNAFFIAGTDTEVGKTSVSVMLLNQFNAMGLKTLGLKPIASGCKKTDGKLYNDDALQLQKASSIKPSYEVINPFAFEEPIAPHIAAEKHNQPIGRDVVVAKIRDAFQEGADIFIVEGVGGWQVPLNDQENMSDVVKKLGIPVVLVVGIKLGCLNHALLTINAINNAGVAVAGWIANCIDPNALVVKENIIALKKKITSPCLGIVPYLDPQNSGTLDDYINVETLV